MNRQRKIDRFEAVALPHLAAIYNLARWLARNDRDAQEIAHEAYLRAFESFDGIRDEEARAWLFTLIHSTYLVWLRKNRDRKSDKSPDEQSCGDNRSINGALERLPVESRELFVLRELEELSYEEIAGIVEAPVDTVMARLARAGILLQEQLEHFNAETRT